METAHKIIHFFFKERRIRAIRSRLESYNRSLETLYDDLQGRDPDSDTAIHIREQIDILTLKVSAITRFIPLIVA